MVYSKSDLLPRVFLLLFASLIVIGCQDIDRAEIIVPQAASGVLDLSHWDFQEKGQIPLEGEWRFLWNELRPPREIAATDDGHYVNVPDKWHHYKIDGETLDHRGYASFSLKVILPEDEEFYGLFFDGAGSAYSLWVNGEQLIKSGTVGTSKEQMVPEKIPHTAFIKSSTETMELVVHISNFNHKKGGFRNSLYIGSCQQILRSQRNAWVLEAVTLGILLIMGLYHLFVYFFRKKAKSAFYFSLLCFSFLLRLGITNEDLFLLAFPFLTWTIAFYLEYLCLFFIPLLVAFFYRSLFPQDIPRRFIHLLTVISILFSLFVILAGTYQASFLVRYYQILIILEIVYYSYFLLRINLRKREGAKVVTAASLVLFITSSIEILGLWDWLASDKIGVYGFLSFIFVQSILLSKRYSHAFVHVESLTEELKSTNQVLQLSETRYRNFFEHSIDILFLTDADSTIKDVSPSCETILGYKREELLKRKATDLFQNLIYDSIYLNICKTRKPVSNLETILKHRDGRDIETLITLSLRSDENGIPLGLQGSVHDNTDKKRAEREQLRALELEQIALTDPLTKAYNRRFFSEYAMNELERAQRKQGTFSLVMMDIDYFKNVNDQYGHLIGDKVLVNLTGICLDHIRSTDIFARYGGEEFVILFSDFDGPATQKRVDLLRDNVSKTVIACNDEEEIRITISLGISCWSPGQGTDLTELMNQADKALYHAKETGRNRSVLFQNENYLVYQPQD